MKGSLAEDLYVKLMNEEDARVCRDISDEACREVPHNFVLILISSLLTKLGDAVANPKTTLTWMMDVVGAPVALTGLLVPIRESGSLIPQLAIAAIVRRQPVRKVVWVVGSIVQGLSMGTMALAALWLDGTAAGLAVVGALVVFSLARGLCSVASKDVLGKTIPKTRRGRVSGLSAGFAGIATLAVGAGLVAFAVDDGAQRVFVGLLAGAAGLWIVAAAVYARVDEEPGETDGGGNAFGEALRRMRLLVEDRAFGMFVVVRALLLCSALSAPYYVLLARQHSGGFTGKLGLFIVAGGLASSLSAPLWGRLADWSSRRVMGVAAVVTGVLGMVVFIAETWIPVLGGAVGFYPMVYFVLMVAHSGVRLGRKTYVVDLAQGNRRTDYVAVSNTVIGVILLVLGSLGALAQAFSVPIVVLVLSMLGLFGAALSRWLPEVT
jgi:hypothetical protein